MLKIKSFEFNYFAERCYIVWNEDKKYGGNCLIIDPGCLKERENVKLESFIEDEGLTAVAVLLTHTHPDHCFGVARLCRKYGINVYMNDNEDITLSDMHKLCLGMGVDDVEDFSQWRKSVKDDDQLSFNGIEVKVLATPGHSAGGVCYLVKESADGADNCAGTDMETGSNNGADGTVKGWESDKGAVLFSGDTLFKECIGRSDLIGGDYNKLMDSIFNKLLTLPGETDVLPGHGPGTTISDERMKNPFLLPFNEPLEV